MTNDQSSASQQRAGELLLTHLPLLPGWQTFLQIESLPSGGRMETQQTEKTDEILEAQHSSATY